MSRTRRKFSSQFKADLCVELLKGEKDLNSLASENSLVNFHSKCKMLGGVAEFFSEAFLCRFPPEDLPRPVVYPVHSLPV